jgi:hypothetical protein
VGLYCLAIPFKRLGIALFSSPHLHLRCKRPSLRSAGTDGCGFQRAVAMQTTTRAAAQGRRVLIRKMRPFEEPHTPPLPHGGQASPYGLRLYYRVKAGALQNYGGQVMGVSFQKRHRLTFYGTLVRAVISGVNSPRRDSLSWCQASISYTGRLFAGMGAFDFFGRSLDAIFEKRSPWQTLRVGILYCLNVCAIMERSGNPGLITAQEPVWEPVPQQPPRVF